jgi:SAM-dependent methyltransferase
MKKQKNTISSAKYFYDEVSDFYEKMVDFGKNLDLRINAYKNLFPVKGNIADLGCGIGLDSIALALNGHVVTSFDVSPKMIEETKRNAEKYKVNLTTELYSLESIPKSFKEKFNNVVSVGNTIAHFDIPTLKKAIKKMYSVLLPDGKILLHILNYRSIIKENKRINNIASRDGKIIIRFYDFYKTNLAFNILSFNTDSSRNFNLVSTIHYPHTKSEISYYLKEAGFSKLIFVKNFAGEKFSSTDSKDMFIEAVKL